MLTCANCGRESPEDFAFCPGCALPLGEQRSKREVRKTVTVVFCDVTGSTAMGEKLDPESLRRVMSRYYEAMRIPIERHGGTVEKFIGDAVMAVFGVPQVHEDDALRAVRAADEMRRALTQLNKELERDHGVSLAARIGVNTGEVVAGDPTGEELVLGDAVNVAARFEQAAAPGEVLIGTETLRLVRDAVVVEPLEPLELKGKSEPVPAYRLLDVTVGAAGVTRRLDSPLVGRARQLTQLRQVFDASIDDRSCQLFTVLGGPGVGKSRLVEEFLRGIDGTTTVLRGRCLPYGDGITFFPVGEVVKEAAGLDDFDAPDEVERKICAVLGDDGGQACARLAQLFGIAGGDAATEETFWAVRRFLESVAQMSPLVVVFDDIHWGEATFLDLVEHIADWSRDAPILLLCMARSDLLDLRPTWGGGKPNAATISLGPLSDDECSELMANLLGRVGLPQDASDRILEAAEGTPLFVEEMLSMMIDDGLLARDGGHWVATGDLAAVPVPPTIQALLAARLDRLGSQERAVIGLAAVAGKQFHVGAVAALAADDEPLDVRAALMELVRRDLIGPDRSLLLGEDAFRFRHLLVRDAAYGSIPKGLRATLHERFADWLERVAGDRVEEQEEIVGYHLEQAYRLRDELGPIDDAAADIGLRAAAHLEASANRASERGDAAAAAKMFQRAADLLPTGHPDRARMLYEVGASAAHVGDMRLSVSASDEAMRAAAAAGDRSVEWRARIQRATGAMATDPHGTSTEETRAEFREAVREFEGLGDDKGLASAWIGLAELEWMTCTYEVAVHDAERAADHARVAGDRRLLKLALGYRIAAQYLGTTNPAEGIAAVEAARREIGEDALFHAQSAPMVAAYRAMTGDLDEGRRLAQEALAHCERFGLGFWSGVMYQELGAMENWAGDTSAAERAFRAYYDLLDATGDEGHGSTAAALLALALCSLGRFDEAEGYARIAVEAAAEDDNVSQAGGRAGQALVLSARGNYGEAVALAREAVAINASGQTPNYQGQVAMALAEVLRAAGDTAEARAAAREALGFYEAKGNLPAAAQARALLDSLTT